MSKQVKRGTRDAYSLGAVGAISSFTEVTSVSVIFWPPCLGSGEGSSSTCGGHVATEGLGWMKG
jgi:hypothetical protein